jgi:hypothetical protein
MQSNCTTWELDLDEVKIDRDFVKDAVVTRRMARS